MILKIKDKGMLINIEGLEYRTPVDIDISKVKISKVLMSIRISGIKEFSIVSNDDNINIKRSYKKIESYETPKISDSNKKENNDKILDKIDYKLKDFEKRLLDKIVEKIGSKKIYIEKIDEKHKIIEDGVRSKDPIVDEDNSFFIPDINTKLKLSGSSTEKIAKREDLRDAIEALTSLTKK